MQREHRRVRGPAFVRWTLLVLGALILTGCAGLPQPRPQAPTTPEPRPVMRADPDVTAALQKSGVTSPDGTGVAATVLAPGKVGVWMARTDGSDLRQVTRDLPPLALPPLWTPQGQVLFLDHRLIWQAATSAGVVAPFLPEHLGSSSRIEGFTSDGRLVYLTNWCYCLTPEADRRPKELWSVSLDGSNPLKLTTLTPEHDPTKAADVPAFLQSEPVGLAGGFATLRRYAAGPKPGTLDLVLEAVRLDGKQTKALTRQPAGPDRRLDVTVQGASVAWSYVQQVPVTTPPPPALEGAPPAPTFTLKVLASGAVTLSALVYENAALGVRWTPPPAFAIHETAEGLAVAFRPEGACGQANCPAVAMRSCPSTALGACVPDLPAGFQVPPPAQVQVGTLKATQFVLTRTNAGTTWQERHTILGRTGGALDLIAVTSGAGAPTAVDSTVLGTYQNLLSQIQFLRP